MSSIKELRLKILERLATDDDFRYRFFEDPDAALAEYELPGPELRWFKRLTDLESLKRELERVNLRLMSVRESAPPPMPEPKAPAPPDEITARPQRIVNTGFAANSAPETPLPGNVTLETARPYYFWLEVGELIEGSIEVTPTELPQELPAKARLHVVLFGYESEFQLTGDQDVGQLEIQEDGTVKVVRYAAVPPSLRGNRDLLSRRLFFPVQTPPQAGVYRLRCNIYYQQTLIQARLITMHVSTTPQPMANALISEIDYKLSNTLDGQQLAKMGENRLSIMLNDNGNGTHGFRFLGAENAQELFKNDAALTEGELQDLINMARSELRAVAWQGGGPYAPGKSYRYAGQVAISQLQGDLIQLAKAGFRFYATLVNRLAGGRPQARQLRDMMLHTGQVQIAARRSARLVIPAALIYDYPLDSSLASSDYKLCSEFLSAMNGAAPLEQTPCFQGNCATREALSTVCPSGFWGYRHALGLPVSIADGPDVAVEIPAGEALELTVGVSTDPAFRERPKHEQALQKLQPGLAWHYANTRADTLRQMQQTKPHVLYFYCHGGLAGTIPFIHVGDPKEERGITPDNLTAFDIFWENRRPLVFINGCHTTALEPDSAIDLVTAFVEESYAAGVIGTEITLFEPIAVTFGEECLRRFLVERQPIGEAVRGARLKMLKDKNPLGLVYIPYALAGLRLT